MRRRACAGRPPGFPATPSDRRRTGTATRAYTGSRGTGAGRGMRVLVTGATGLLGSHTAAVLHEREFEDVSKQVTA